MEKNERHDYACGLDDILKALTTCLEHVARRPQARIVAIPALGWHHLSPEDKEVASREMLRLIERFCKKGEAGHLEEVRLCLYSLEAALAFSKTLNDAKQRHIEVLNIRLADARRLASERTDLVYEFHSPAFKTIRERIDAQLDAAHPIVFVGESGVGKQFFGAYVHSHGSRCGQLFHVAGVRNSRERDPWESLMGGKVKDSGNGRMRPPDLLMAANQGTLLIKHLELMPSDVQEIMVHVLDHGEYYPCGADKPKSLDVRLLFASREPLDALLHRGSLLPDLHRRLQPYVIELPPLRKRPEDILPIAMMWLKIYRDEFGSEVTDFDDEVKTLFQSYDWPTNVDQLQSVVEVAVRNAQHGVISRQHVPLQIKYIGEVPPAFAKRKNLYSDYLEFRRRDREDWEHVDDELNSYTREIIRRILSREEADGHSLAVLLQTYTTDYGWTTIWRVLVARRVILGVFKIRKRKWHQTIKSTARLLGYLEESKSAQQGRARPGLGAFVKYLNDLGLTLDIVEKATPTGLFPDELHMLEQVGRWRMSRSK